MLCVAQSCPFPLTAPLKNHALCRVLSHFLFYPVTLHSIYYKHFLPKAFQEAPGILCALFWSSNALTFSPFPYINVYYVLIVFSGDWIWCSLPWAPSEPSSQERWVGIRWKFECIKCPVLDTVVTWSQDPIKVNSHTLELANVRVISDFRNPLSLINLSEGAEEMGPQLYSSDVLNRVSTPLHTQTHTHTQKNTSVEASWLWLYIKKLRHKFPLFSLECCG